jgi:hypothetical protein
VARKRRRLSSKPETRTSGSPVLLKAAFQAGPPGATIRAEFSLLPQIVFSYTLRCAVVVVEGAPV